MAYGPRRPAVTETDVVAPPRPRLRARILANFRRVTRWLWVPLTLPEGERLSVSQRRAVGLARASCALADHALDAKEREPFRDSSARAAALGALRTAAYWAFRAHEGGAVKDVPRDLGEAFEAHAAVAREAAETEARLEAVRAVLVERGAAEDGITDAAVLEADVLVARDFVRSVLREPASREDDREKRWKTRATRLAAVLAVLFVALVATPTFRRMLRPNLARNAVWHTSSATGGYASMGRGFTPKEGGPEVFFQTSIEAEPWIEFDLGEERTIELVGVQNRLDCCLDWPVPLVIEHTIDRQRWTEVGRRIDPFQFWTVTFRPTRARYVRLRVSRETSLHLRSVQIK